MNGPVLRLSGFIARTGQVKRRCRTQLRQEQRVCGKALQIKSFLIAARN
jgi:hypothetical protein